MRAIVASIFLCFSLSSYGSNVDSLLQFYDTKTDTTYLHELCDMGVSVYQEDIGLAISLMQKALDYSNKINYINGKVRAYTGLSSLNFRNGNLENSLDACSKGIALVEEYNLPAEKKVNFLINRGSAYISAEKYGEAVEAFTIGAKVARDNKLDKKRGMLLNNMGILYRRLKRYDEAISTYDEGFALRTSLKDSVGMANTLLNRGASYAKLDKMELTLADLKKAESIYGDLGMTTDVMECQLGVGSAYFDTGDFDKAYEYLAPLYENATFKPGKEAYFNLRLYMASLYLKRKQYAKGTKALDEIKEIEEQDWLEQKTKYYQLKTLIAKETGRASEALVSLDKYVDLKEQFFNEENAEFRTEMETKYRTAEKDYEIDQLGKEQEITELKLKAASQRNIALGIGVLMLGGFLWWLSRLNKKIRKQNKVISKANADKAILLKEIHHRVKNNLQVVSSLLSLQTRFVKDDTALLAIKTGKTRVQSMSLLHQKLYQNKDLKGVNIKEYFSDLASNIYSNYNIKEGQVMFESDVEDIELDVDTLVPMGLITNELISNSLKYGFPDDKEGMIKLKVKRINDEILLQVKDDGVGLPFDSLPKNADSLGVRLIASFAEKLNAKVKIDNVHGADIKLFIPISSYESND